MVRIGLFLGTSAVQCGQAPGNISVLSGVIGNIMLHFTVWNWDFLNFLKIGSSPNQYITEDGQIPLAMNKTVFIGRVRSAEVCPWNLSLPFPEAAGVSRTRRTTDLCALHCYWDSVTYPCLHGCRNNRCHPNQSESWHQWSQPQFLLPKDLLMCLAPS